MSFQGPAMQSMMSAYMEQSRSVFLQMQEQLQKQTRNMFPGFPFPGFPGMPGFSAQPPGDDKTPGNDPTPGDDKSPGGDKKS
jgi:hypothetical protein